jgi:hypothetical protein
MGYIGFIVLGGLGVALFVTGLLYWLIAWR